MNARLPFSLLLVIAAACGPDDSNTAGGTAGTNNLRTDDSNRFSPNNSAANNTSNNGTDGVSTHDGSTNDGSTNNTPTNNGTPNNGATNNGSTNNGSGPNNLPGDVTESEPNDDRASATRLVLGDVVSGSAEAGGEDVFVFDGAAGTILEIEVAAADPTLDVSAFLEDGSGEFRDRRIDVRAGWKRQFFLPETDAWYISVRSFDVEDRSYEFVVREITPTPISNAFSGVVAGDLDDRAVDVYELPDAEGEIVATLEAERLASGSELDSVMYVYSPTQGFVTFNDDASGTTDSEVDFDASAGVTYWLVVDAWRLGADNPYELLVSLP